MVLELVALAPACSTLASAAPLERTGGTGAACSTLASAAPRALELVELAPACSTLASAAPRALELVELAPACSTLASAAPLERTGGAGAACSTLAVLPVSGLQPRNRPIFFSVSGPVAGLSA